MKAIFTIGVSASGKTTWAESQKNVINSNRDDIRFCLLVEEGSLDRSERHLLWTKWNFKRETEVNAVEDQQIQMAMERKKDIIFSNTNLNEDRLRQSMKRMEDLGFEVETKVFQVPSIDEVIKRDAKRSPSVGEAVLRKQWRQWLELGEGITGIRQYERDIQLPPCIVVDIDGTVAKMHNRGPFDWHKVGQDHPRVEILDLVHAMSNDMNVVFLSGRDSICEGDTREWLKTHCSYGSVQKYELFMRKQNDMRKDRIIKEELFWKHVAPRYNVVFAIDDRRQMVHFWNDIGVTLLNVGSPYDDF